MALSNEQQAIELISRAKRILIVTKEHASVDAQASVAALLSFLKKQHKEADAVLPSIDTSRIPNFLPEREALKPTVGAMRAFLLTLDVTQTPLSELLYDVKDGKLHITVVPKQGEWSPKDVTFKHGEDRYDLVIALDCSDMASLGTLFREHADFLYRTPVINIDRDPGNEHWGQLNLVDLTAVSTTEVLFGLFERWNKNAIDEHVATALLAGMIAKTNSFRTANVTPKTLQAASELIAMGAKREEIVHGLWRSRSVPMLKLWGRALSRLETDRELGLVWSVLTRQDFVEAGVHHSALEGIVNELIAYSPEAKVITLISEDDNAHNGAHVSIHTVPPYSAQELGRTFGANGSRDTVSFNLSPGESLVEGTKKIIDRLRETLKTIQ
jgi:phosphoesterase RecJ-like protein